jgi:hypothetical protein
MKKRVLFLGMFLSSIVFADKYDVISSTVDKYKRLANNKALAVAVDESGNHASSWAYDYSTRDRAIASALKRCKKGRLKYSVQSECVVYMVDNQLYGNNRQKEVYEEKDNYNNLRDYEQKLLTKKREHKTWSPIDYDDLYKLISGNTLISKSKRFCETKYLKQDCLKIAILSKSKGFGIGRKNATIIYPDLKKIEKNEWGYYAQNLMFMALHTGITPIPTDSDRYSFKELVSINKNKTIFRMGYPNSKEKIEVVIVKGQNNKLIINAKKGNYRKVDNTGRMSIGQALLNKIGDSLANASKRSSSYTPKYEYCGGRLNDNCYQLIRFKKSGSAIIKCTKGPSTGKEKCLSYKKSSKKYATGCGFSDSFAHHYTLEKAGNQACEY